MSRRDSGPPGETGGAPTPESACHHQRQPLTKESQHSQCSRHLGRYGRTRRPAADLWTEGYCYGFLAALRDVARATDDPEVWVVLDRVGENFTGPAAADLRAGRRR